MIKLLVSGIDDGYFPLIYKRGKGKCPLVSVTYEEYNLVDIDFELITVDGKDGVEKYNLLRKGEIKILDSIIVGGFNYIVPDKNYIIYYSFKPNVDKIVNALIKHYNDERVEIFKNFLSNLIQISTKRGTVYISTDLEIRVAKTIIEKYQIFSKVPEPIRTAHIIGKSLGKFSMVMS